MNTVIIAKIVSSEILFQAFSSAYTPNEKYKPKNQQVADHRDGTVQVLSIVRVYGL